MQELPARVRSILGLFQMGWRSRVEIANTVFNPVREKPTRKQVAKVRSILNSTDVRIRRARMYGIDFCGTGQIARPIRCPSCGQRIIIVPCVSCYVAPGIKGVAAEEIAEQRPVVPEHETTALAGSEDKIEVMRNRVLSGEAVFHPKDPIYEPPTQPVGSIRSDFGLKSRKKRNAWRYC